MVGVKPSFLELRRYMDLHNAPPQLMYLLEVIYNVLEDTYSVGTPEELQEAIDSIGTGAGAIHLESGTFEITTPIDIDNCGSIVIYGKGDSSILKPADGITVFNITCCASLLIKTLKIDTTNYTGATQAVIVNETNDNIVGFEDVTIDGTGGTGDGIGIELLSDNCIIDKCNITVLQTGIYLNGSENHIINNNLCGLNTNYGIHLNLADNNTLSGNSLVSNTFHGIYIFDSDYCIISHNGCFDNLLTGIYEEDSNNNTISGNICNGNFQNGIYLTNSNYNTVSGNTTNNNDSNTVNPQAGIFITTNSDFNTISANSCNNNNNAGIGGIGYGILIHTATCNENVVASNNANGNDVDFMDSGTATTITYYVQDAVELQDAIDSIGTKAGIINIEGSFIVSATITIDGNGSYIIRGAGSNTTLTTVGDISCFNIDVARQVIMRNFTIDASSITTATREIIDVNEDLDNIIIVDNIVITGDGTNGYGIELNSLNCRIVNCTIDNVNIGINVLSNSNIIEGNNTNNCASYGIQIGADYNNITSNISNNNLTGIYVLNGTGNSINNNIVLTNTQNGIYLNGSSYNSLNDNICDGNDSNTANPQGGIVIDAVSNNNTIISNTSINNNNAGAGKSYGVYIGNANCNNNIVRSNSVSGNDIAWNDLGTNSDFEYRCSSNAEIQNAIDSIAGKSGIIIILSGTILITTTIDVDGGGDYVIMGEGVGSILETVGNISCFNITIAKSCILKDFKIDATSLTVVATDVISITEASNNKIIIDNILITGDGTNGYGIGINSDYINIRNCNIQSLNRGINLVNADYCNISGNYFNNIVYGIYTNASTYNIISTNIFDLGTTAITLMGASLFCSLNTNTCSGQTNRAIYLSGGSNYCSVVGTINYNSLGGIKIYQTSFCDVSGNIIRKPTAGNEGGIYLEECDNCVVSNNILQDSRGNVAIRLRYNNNTTVSGNSINGSYVWAIGGVYCYSCSIIGNSIQDSKGFVTPIYGVIEFLSGSDNDFIGNTILDCNSNQIQDTGAIGLLSEDRDLIEGNVIRDVVNGGAGGGYGFFIDGACNDIVIGINQISLVDTGNIKDNGTGTILFGDDTVFGASWNTNMGTATKNAIYDAITSFFPIGVKIDYFGTGIKGVIATRDYEISIANGDDFDMFGCFVANGQASTPNCLDKFVRNEATSGVVGGSDDAILVSHSHMVRGSSSYPGATFVAERNTSNAVSYLISTDTQGEAGAGKNIPAKISAIPVIRMS